MNGLKTMICTGIGIVGSTVAAAFGGWDAAMITLISMMVIDYLTGVYVVRILWYSGRLT